MVAVRAAYNDKEIAFHLTWDDATNGYRIVRILRVTSSGASRSMIALP